LGDDKPPTIVKQKFMAEESVLISVKETTKRWMSCHV